MVTLIKAVEDSLGQRSCRGPQMSRGIVSAEVWATSASAQLRLHPQSSPVCKHLSAPQCSQVVDFERHVDEIRGCNEKEFEALGFKW